jgi:hypothetical protein
VALAPSGAAAVVLGDDTAVRVTVRRPGATFGPLIQLGERGPIEQQPRVAADDRGDAAVLWGAEDHAALAGYMSAGSPAWQTLELAAARPADPGGPLDPALVIDDRGRATASWEESDGDTVRTVTRDFDASGAAPPVQVGALPTFLQVHPASACRPRDGRVVRSWSRGTMFRRDLSLYGCLFGRGVPVPLFDGIFPSRTSAIAGPLVAHGDDFADEYEAYTRLRVTDLRDEVSGVNRVADLETTRVGELARTRLRADGAVAWISCPRRHSPFGRLSRRCERPGGRLKHVWAFDSTGAEPRLLDSGRGIDPRTLRLRGSRLTWRKAGELRRAILR